MKTKSHPTTSKTPIHRNARLFPGRSPRSSGQEAARRKSWLRLRIPASILSFSLLPIIASSSGASTQEVVSEFGIHSQLPWIVDVDRNGVPDDRVNYGDITDIPLPADYDGDGSSDLAVVRDVAGQWEWIVDTNRNGTPDLRVIYGQSTDFVRPADYNGDGATDFAVLRDVAGQWEWIVDVNRNGIPDLRVTYGNSSDRPRPGDYNGDGATDLAVLRDVAGQWEWIVDIQRDGIPDIRIPYGNSTDFAKPADYNGDGATDFAVLRDVEGQWEWIVDYNLDGVPDLRRLYGDTTDFARPADYDGDGAADFAVVRQVGGQWEWIVDTDRNGVFNFRHVYGDVTDYVRPGDYDGDGAADFAVVRKQHYIHGAAWAGLAVQIDNMVMDHLRDQNIPGATLAISKAGRLVLAKGYGFRNAVTKTPMLPYHRSKIGSVSKILTSMGALKLTEQVPWLEADTKLYGPAGALSHPDYLNAIQQNIANQDDAHPVEWFTGLSLAHILSHSAGFGSAEKVETTATNLDIPLEDFTYKQVHVNFLSTVPIQHEPGTLAPYNNHHLGVVGHLIEEVSGQDYGDYISQNILAPTGLDHVQFEDGTVDWQESYAHQYVTVCFGDTTDFVRPADYNGDGRADYAVLRDVDGQWEWIVDFDRDGTPDLRQIYGERTDHAWPADYDGDGATDFAVLRDVDGQWEWIVDTNRNGVPNLRVLYGNSSDRPRPRDYDGDGATDFAVLRDVDGQWEWILDTNRDGVPEPELRKIYGNSTDLAIPDDFDGDGMADFAVLRNVDSKWEWIVDTDRDGIPEPALRQIYGDTSDDPHPADYDGDGATDFAVLRTDGTVLKWIIDTDHNGVSNLRVDYGAFSDFPRPADYSGDGATDLAVVRPSGGRWQWFYDSNLNGTSDVSGVVVMFDAQPNFLGRAAGGWTASARDLAVLMHATDATTDYPGFLTSATVDLMENPGAQTLDLEFPIQTFDQHVLGWKRQSNGALSHDGALGGGSAFIIKHGETTTPLDGVDVSGVQVAIMLNIDNSTGRSTLVNDITKLTAQMPVDPDFDLFEVPFAQSDSLNPGGLGQLDPGTANNPYRLNPILAHAFGVGAGHLRSGRSPLPRITFDERGDTEVRFELSESISPDVRIVVEKSENMRTWEAFAIRPARGGAWIAEHVSVNSEDSRFLITLKDRIAGSASYYRLRAELEE